jgi:transposase InsO family protein
MSFTGCSDPAMRTGNRDSTPHGRRSNGGMPVWNIDMRSWPTKAGLRRGLFEYIEGWYNTRRLHSSLGYVSPTQYEAIHHNADSQAA